MSADALTREELRGYGIAVLVMTLFGVVWATLGLSEIEGMLAVTLYLVGGFIALALLVGAVRLLRAAGRASHADPSFDGARIRKRFNQVGAVEGVGIVAVVFVCARLGYPEWIPATIALVVGLHFFPLAFLFSLPLYHATGAVLCFLAMATPFAATVLNAPDSVWYAIPGLGAAVVLWATGAALIFSGSPNQGKRPR